MLQARVAFSTLLLLGISWAGGAAAEITLYEGGGIKITGGLDGAVGGFGAFNTDFGAGNFNTSGGGRKVDRGWFEGYFKPRVAGELELGGSSLYGAASFIYATTRGDGDAFSSLAQQNLRSTTGNSPSHGALEDLYLGWKSGALFASLGEDAVDVSAGYQSFSVGDGFVVGDGTLDAFGRGAYWIGPRNSFEKTAILRFNPSALAPVRGQVFHLATRTNQGLLLGNDQARASLVGANIELYKSGRTGAVAADGAQGTKEDSAEAAPEGPKDQWTIGAMFLKLYDADSRGAFSFAGGPPSPYSPGPANRDGLSVFDIRAGGAFFDAVPGLTFNAEFVYQLNDRSNRRVRANAWTGEVGYKFQEQPWTPSAFYRYSHFSGDSNPNDTTKGNYDSLFFAGGLRGDGPGTWFLGEIYSQYLGALSNLNVHQIGLRASPRDDLNVGLLYYLMDFDSVRQFQNIPGPPITSTAALHEINVYAEYEATPWLSLMPLAGVAIPRDGYIQAAKAQVAVNGPPAGVDKPIYLIQAVASIKF